MAELCASKPPFNGSSEGATAGGVGAVRRSGRGAFAFLASPRLLRIYKHRSGTIGVGPIAGILDDRLENIPEMVNSNTKYATLEGIVLKRNLK